MIEIQRQQCLEEAQLEDETMGESGGSREVAGSLLSPAPSKAQLFPPSTTVSWMGIKSRDPHRAPGLRSQGTHSRRARGLHAFLAPPRSGEFPALIWEGHGSESTDSSAFSGSSHPGLGYLREEI